MLRNKPIFHLFNGTMFVLPENFGGILVTKTPVYNPG